MLPRPAEWEVEHARRRGRFPLARRAAPGVVGVALLGAIVLGATRLWPTMSIALFGSGTTVRDDELALSIEVPNRIFRADEPIPITATLTYIGQADTVTLSSLYPDVVYFSLEQLDGPLDTSGGANRLICHDSLLHRAVAQSIPFRKAGGYEASESEAPFWAAYYSDPLLRLPTGSWRVGAHLRTAIDDDCSKANHSLDTAVDFSVGP
ncbi:MAG TPA: hypothetical protein VFI28_02540 [Candidatus Limnocylindrales bacterium]|nr:hypothetical protein [Candidatus Limnocylindrales bacterium]